MFYILNDDKTFRSTNDVLEWSEYLLPLNGNKERNVAYDDISGNRISTDFIGLNLRHITKKPYPFETIVFDENDNDIYCKQYSTWKEAEEGHKEAIKWILRNKVIKVIK